MGPRIGLKREGIRTVDVRSPTEVGNQCLIKEAKVRNLGALLEIPGQAGGRRSTWGRCVGW